ncbi:unnamed protein product [Hymenolepis diminuta]|uniref:Proteasome assembly chaperone 4 n=1 Tax=Hymenolepis diminuta TaxID=6216 RepID=A0A0R3SQP1_HYMDI|nr:unnamed protein product [Hymenolepis diminuta]
MAGADWMYRNLEIDSTGLKYPLKSFIMQLNSSYFIWIGDSSKQFFVSTSSILHSNSLFPSARSSPETTLSKRLAKRLSCPVYLSLSVDRSMLDNWDLVDPITRKTLSEEVETQLLCNFSDVLRIQRNSK